MIEALAHNNLKRQKKQITQNTDSNSTCDSKFELAVVRATQRGSSARLAQPRAVVAGVASNLYIQHQRVQHHVEG